MKIKKIVIIIVIIILVYFLGIKACDVISMNIFDEPSLFRTTDLIYINPYASKESKQIYTKNKKEEENRLKNRKNNPLVQQRQDWGQWDYEINEEIHKNKYEEEFLLLANAAREFNKLEASRFNNLVKDKGDSEKIINNLELIREKSIKKYSLNKDNINKYIDILIDESNKAIESNNQIEFSKMPDLFKKFAHNYEEIIEGKHVELSNNI